MEKKTATFDEILNEEVIPAVAADQNGIIFYVNDRFEEEYGWDKDDLIGNNLTTIIPPYMRDAHNLGFSSFLNTREHRILGEEISLPVYCKGGSILNAMHFIIGRKMDGKWQFAALIDPE